MKRNMKQTIASAACFLLHENPGKKLTVSDIVQYCGITRKTFYYHFENIPDLLQWIMEQQYSRLMENDPDSNPESNLYQFLLLAVSLKSTLGKSMDTDYQNELSSMLAKQILKLVEQIATRAHLDGTLNADDYQFILNYHCGAILSFLEHEKDFSHLQHNSHLIYVSIVGK